MNISSTSYTYNNISYPITLKWDYFNYEDLILNIAQVRKWCEEGCQNFDKNGGCPPYSPTAEEIFKGKEFILLTCKLYTCDVKANSLPDKSKLMEEVLVNYMDELGYKVRAELGVDFLNPGYCRGCRECTIASGCKAPDKRVYSITGTGIMLSDTIKNLFSEELQWFKKESQPDYLIKIMAFTSSDTKEKINLLDKL